MENIINLTATEIGRRISRSEICPVELVETYIERINSLPESESIFSTLMFKNAIIDAKKAKDRVKRKVVSSSLDGVPISWKDLFDTAKIPTEAGSELLKNRIPEKNAAVIENAKKAGLVSLAKTHMTELAFSGLGVNPITKTPPNSLSSSLAPGGSSSGAAVSVSLNLVSCAVGSDTGGSVRVPAAWNNLVGFKPTYGILSLKGVVPLCPKFDTVGPIVKSVEDAAGVFSALHFKKEISLLDINLTKTKMAILQTNLLDDLDSTIKISFEESVESLKKSGAQISVIKSAVIEEILELSAYVYSPEAYGTWKHLIEKEPLKMHQPILERFRSGAKVDGPTYVKAWQTLEELKEHFLSLTARFDVMLAPTTPILPPKTIDLIKNNSYFSEQNLLTLRNTRLANLLGFPALSLPTKTNFCGFMLMGKPLTDNFLLSIGKKVEQLLK